MASSGAQEGISERKQGKQPAEGLPPNEDLDMTKLSMATPKSLTADADSAPMQGEDGNEPEGEQQEPETPTKSKKKKNRPNKKKTKSPAVEIKAPPTKMEKAMAQATTEARRQELRELQADIEKDEYLSKVYGEAVQNEVKKVWERQAEFRIAIGGKEIADTLTENFKGLPKTRDVDQNAEKRCQFILSHEAVREWMNGTHGSRVLVLNGNEKADGKNSPTRVLSEKVDDQGEAALNAYNEGEVTALSRRNLVYSCAWAPNREARDILVYFIGRLIPDDTLSVQLPDLKDRKTGHKKVLTFSELLEFFVNLVKQELERKAFWVIIEDVSVYQSGKIRKLQMQELFNCLAKLANKASGKVNGSFQYPFRLAVTSATTTSIADEMGDKANVVTVENIAQTNQRIEEERDLQIKKVMYGE